jgi:hypothetical protein
MLLFLIPIFALFSDGEGLSESLTDYRKRYKCMFRKQYAALGAQRILFCQSPAGGQECEYLFIILLFKKIRTIILVYSLEHGVTKRCRLSWLTNSALVFAGRRGELRGLSQSVQHYTGSQINFEDLTPYLTYGWNICRHDS